VSGRTPAPSYPLRPPLSVICLLVLSLSPRLAGLLLLVAWATSFLLWLRDLLWAPNFNADRLRFLGPLGSVAPASWLAPATDRLPASLSVTVSFVTCLVLVGARPRAWESAAYYNGIIFIAKRCVNTDPDELVTVISMVAIIGLSSFACTVAR
jgi:hypothetical protein